MNYQQTIDYLFSQLPMYQRIGPAAYKANLNNTLKISTMLGHPERSLSCVHIAGTNGKGSVAHMLAAVFQAHGLKTGLATSPHLKDFRERIRVNGRMIPKSYVSRFVRTYRSMFEPLQASFFEISIGLTFRYFADEKTDVAIIETGLGGRLDSTNIITPQLSVITNIGLDHTNLLGDTLKKIAAEKAGIIKAGVPVLIGTKQTEVHGVFESIASEQLAPLYVASDMLRLVMSGQATLNRKPVQQVMVEDEGTTRSFVLDQLGSYQTENLLTVLAALKLLQKNGYTFQQDLIYSALSDVSRITGLKGRWQIIGRKPLVICDTGHNKDGLAGISKQLQSYSYTRLRMVIGMVDDKDTEGILSCLPREAVYYFCRPDVPRGMDARELAGAAAGIGLKGRVFDSVRLALETARTEAATTDLVFVGGSTFVVAEVV
jgi:dihydrofolate synthase / folylpolyglutamate synthase